ncbi:Conjugative transposon protein TcpC (plasmid) [Streptomyces sp. YIM 121038]|uniref:conjugal transfer protein n=1 Tax=Streptomyces sp. YIM 121038 TaxID=2136401 RepID=UPI0011637045|nr:conjugal transfer protein [Streptomyces sp. YIM 121038]QCX82264.1 Conjugative transposon protein TcpC [Streptomyces sp. YIM 121038]
MLDSPPSPGSAAPPTAAGAALCQMNRRVQLGRLMVLAALTAGPLALLVSAWPSPSTSSAAPASKPQRTSEVAAHADPAGYAAEFVDAWLRTTDDPTSPAAERARSLAPEVALPSRKDGAPMPRRVTPVRSIARGGGAWSVTVAVQFEGAVRYFAVPTRVSADGGSAVMTGAPALVPAPGRLAVPDSPYGVSVESGPLTATVRGFLAAYLAGQGEVTRYLAPGARASAVSPAATSVAVREVSAREDAAADGLVPRPGARVHVLAQVEARDGWGRWPLAYELTLSARGDRWEISAIAAGGGR